MCLLPMQTPKSGLSVTQVIPCAIFVAIRATVEVFVFDVMFSNHVWIIKSTQVAVRGAEVLCLIAMLWVLYEEVVMID